MIISHVAGVVGRHDGVVGVGLKLAMHDLVSVWRVLAAEVSVGVDVEGAAKHAPVELQSLAGVAVEVEVGIQPRRHRLLLPPRDRRDSRAPPPGPADRINRSAAAPRRPSPWRRPDAPGCVSHDDLLVIGAGRASHPWPRPRRRSSASPHGRGGAVFAEEQREFSSHAAALPPCVWNVTHSASARLVTGERFLPHARRSVTVALLSADTLVYAVCRNRGGPMKTAEVPAAELTADTLPPGLAPWATAHIVLRYG